jgi:hypothetical protein
MKFAMIALTLMTALTVQAGWWGGGPLHPPGPYYPPAPNYGAPVTCTASDSGWEEHFGGHRDCDLCLSRHGNCTETCSVQQYNCRVEGRVFDYWTNGTRIEVFYGRGNSRWEAEEQAMSDCRWARAECMAPTCTLDTQVVSRRSCR